MGLRTGLLGTGMAKKPDSEGEARRKRTQRPFPASAFEEALSFAKELFAFGSGQPVRRLSLFDHLKKAPDSGASRMLITNANKYGFTKGSYVSDQLELTPDGRKAVDDGYPKREQAQARTKLAVLDIEPFKLLYERFINARLPAKAVLIDAIKEFGVAEEFAEEGVDTFIVNLRFVELLQTLSGADRIVSLDHLLDSLPASRLKSDLNQPLPAIGDPASGPRRAVITQGAASYETTCFYITAIGDEGTDERKHSDLFLGNIAADTSWSFLCTENTEAANLNSFVLGDTNCDTLPSRRVILDVQGGVCIWPPRC
jgi:hypothetical protein